VEIALLRRKSGQRPKDEFGMGYSASRLWRRAENKIKAAGKGELSDNSLFHSCGDFTPNSIQKQVKFSDSRFAPFLPFS